jgi:Tol biopolymer transport system component
MPREEPQAAPSEPPAEQVPRLAPFEAAPEVLARVEHLERRIAEKPDAKALYLQLSQVYSDAGRKDLAASVLDRLLAVDPQNHYVRHRLDQLKRPGASAPSSTERAVTSRPRPRPPRPSGPLATVREWISRRPKTVALAAGLLVLVLVGLSLLFPSTRRIASGEFRAFGAEWSPTGRRFAFLIEENEGVQLAVYELRAGSHRIIGGVGGWDTSAYSWSPDGGRIAYEGPLEEDAWEGSIWVADVVSGDTRRVGTGSSPAWFSDGTSLLIACNPRSLPESLSDWPEPLQNRCRLDLVTGDSRVVLGVESWEVSFSPAVNRIAYTGMELDPEAGYDLTASEDFEQLVDRVTSDNPANVLEGTRNLAREIEARRYMESRRAGGSEEPLPYESDVYVMDLLDARPSRITTDGRSSFVSWTPDGRRILYAVAGPSGAEVRTMNPDGGDQRVVIPASIGVTDPHSVTLTANGKYALFVAPVEADPAVARIMTGESPADIHVLSVGSTSAERLQNKHPFKQRYALSPDGKRLVYEVLTDVRLQRRAKSELWLMSR